MKNSNLATRYARAIHSLAQETGSADKVFEQMRIVEQAMSSDQAIVRFFDSAMVRPQEKQKVISAMCEAVQMADSFRNFLLLLAKKNRLGVYPEILVAYQKISDEAHGVTRGSVRSAAVLDPDGRKRIESLVSQATQKQVILTYKEDPSLLGGLVAEVGSYTFDDSLTSHLTRINEQITRSAH